ncbi:hypothetical protein [Comamonas sp. Tr-654]|uniref:hypothetical protein n=1 Tax=Comamonas sp. Tr-654 TaxID=2608341 RepID=UPI001965FE96|nr:hypothetical protein [Comamonas sp. Tr-654]
MELDFSAPIKGFVQAYAAFAGSSLKPQITVTSPVLSGNAFSALVNSNMAGLGGVFDPGHAVLTLMVYVKNEGSHGLMVYQTECVDLTLMNYLLGQAPAQRLTKCQGKPLPLDAQVQKLQARSTRSLPTSGQEPSNFEDPELARVLIERLRKAIGSASLH